MSTSKAFLLKLHEGTCSEHEHRNITNRERHSKFLTNEIFGAINLEAKKYLAVPLRFKIDNVLQNLHAVITISKSRLGDTKGFTSMTVSVRYATYARSRMNSTSPARALNMKHTEKYPK